MVLSLLVLLATIFIVGPAAAQDTPIPPLVSHVIVDSCSGCGGGPIGQTTMANSAAVVVASDQSAIHTICDSGCASPPATPDNVAFTAGTTNVTIAAGVFNDGLAGVTSGNSAAPRITGSRAIHTNLRTNAGVELGTAANPLQVTLENTSFNAAPVEISGVVNASILATPVGQQAMNNSMPVVLASNQTAIPVNPISGQTGVAGNTGTVGATTQRVTLATDVALPTGSNSIGQVTANAGTNLNTSALALEAGGNLATIAGTVSAARAAVNPISGQAGVQGNTGVVTATTQRVVLATDVTASVAGTKSPDTAAPGATNIGTLPAVATAFVPAYTEGNQVPLSTNLSGGIRITGAVSATVTGVKSNNNLPPDSLNMGALVAVANAVAPTYSEGNEVLLSTTLNGAVRTLAAGVATATTTGIGASMQETTLLASNGARTSFVIQNQSRCPMLAKFGTGIGSRSFNLIVQPGAQWVAPSPMYTGVLTGIWTCLDGWAVVTEM